MVKTNVVDFCKQLNKRDTYKRICDLEVGGTYIINDMRILKTKFGKRVQIKSDGFMVYLPESWNDKITPDMYKHFKQLEDPLYLLYNGIEDLNAGKTRYKIEFVSNKKDKRKRKHDNEKSESTNTKKVKHNNETESDNNSESDNEIESDNESKIDNFHNFIDE